MTSTASWTTLQKWGFRFLFCYVLLFILPIPFSSLISITDFSFISIEFTAFIAELIASLVITGIWSFLDAKRTNYQPLVYWFKLSLRASLFINMMVYGFVKVAASQFGEPTLIQLVTPVGELSPMRLLWIYMGYSAIYQIFTGLLEVAGGFLMLFRKTTTLGALLIAGVMSNVALMNFMYDIPVKSLSSHLFFFALILATFDFKRILYVFILNRKVDPVSFSVPIQTRWYELISLWTKRIMIGLVFLGFLACAILPFTPFKNSPEPELYGIYKVSSQDPSFSENAWQYFVMDRNDLTYIRYEFDSKPYSRTIDTESQTMTLSPTGPGSERTFFYKKEDEMLYLTEPLDNDTLNFTLQRVDEYTFRLKK
jgi:hypothetical protein